MNLSGPNGLTAGARGRLAPDGTFLDGRIHPGRQERPGGPRLDPTGAVIPVVRRLSQEDFGADRGARLGRRDALPPQGRASP